MNAGKNIVIIPTYNEKENIECIIRYVLNLSLPFDILVVDDNSPDGTREIVKRIQSEFPERLFLLEREGKLGLGTAYLFGFQWSLERGYSKICEMDADFSHDPNDLLRLSEACDKGCDLAIGSRYVSGITVINWPIGRVLMSFFASRYVRLITRMPVQDPTSGFVCYRREVLESINFNKIRFKGYAFQIGMKFYTWKLGFNLSEIPIIFKDRTLGVSKMSGGIFKEAIVGVLLMKIRSLFSHYYRK